MGGAIASALFGLLARETLGVLRERKIERLRRAASDAHAINGDRDARAVVKDLDALYAKRADTARARTALAKNLIENGLQRRCSGRGQLCNG